VKKPVSKFAFQMHNLQRYNEVKWGLGAKAREQTEGFRQTVKNVDANLGLSRFLKNTVPPLWVGLRIVV
jgi:hypothetical protein